MKKSRFRAARLNCLDKSVEILRKVKEEKGWFRQKSLYLKRIVRNMDMILSILTEPKVTKCTFSFTKSASVLTSRS